MIRDERIPSDELQRIDEEIRSNWPTGADVDFEEAIEYHESLPEHKRFADVLESADKPLLQPRAGVPRLDDQIELLEYLHQEGQADLLPTTIDSYTRDNEYEKAQQGLEKARETGDDTLNGFPAVNHGVEGCRKLIDAIDAPIEVRHGTPDARLLAAITFAGGFQSFEGGPISYNIPYTKRHGLEETIKRWQFVRVGPTLQIVRREPVCSLCLNLLIIFFVDIRVQKKRHDRHYDKRDDQNSRYFNEC